MPLKGITQGIKKDTNTYNSQSATVKGTQNLVSKLAYNVTITGDNNRVMASAQNINLIGSSNCFISSGVQNVTLINCDGITINDSDVTYINNQLVQ